MICIRQAREFNINGVCFPLVLSGKVRVAGWEGGEAIER